MFLSSMINICLKDLRLLLADKSAIFFTIGFPLIMATFFGTIFSGSGSTAGISLAVADLDKTEQSIAYIDSLKTSDALRVTELDAVAAKEKVRKGKIAAVLIIPEGFGEAKKSLFDANTPTIQLGIDPSRKAAAGMLKGILMAQAAEDMQKQFTDTSAMMSELDAGLESLELEQVDDPELKTMLSSIKNWMKTDSLDSAAEDSSDTSSESNTDAENENADNAFQGFTPMNIEDEDIQREKTGPKNAYAVSFPQGMVWGIIGAITTYSLALISEVNAGTLGRLSSAPISRMTILGGKALACFLTIFMVSLFLIIIATLVFKVPIYSWPLLLLTMVACSLGFSGLMMFLAVLGKTEKAASGISWAILMIMAMTGGGMIPLIAMPKWMVSLSEFSPIKWAVVSFEGAFWRQYTLMDLLPVTSLLLALGIICFVVGTYVFNRREIE